jgi:hypothetical protein
MLLFSSFDGCGLSCFDSLDNSVTESLSASYELMLGRRVICAGTRFDSCDNLELYGKVLRDLMTSSVLYNGNFEENSRDASLKIEM